MAEYDFSRPATSNGGGGTLALLLIGGLALMLVLLALFGGSGEPVGEDGVVLPAAEPVAPAVPADG